MSKSVWLNIYHDPMPHGDSILEGDAKTLRVLAGALRQAAAAGYARHQPFDSDGEGYTLHIVAAKEPCGAPDRPSEWGGDGCPEELWRRVMALAAGEGE